MNATNTVDYASKLLVFEKRIDESIKAGEIDKPTFESIRYGVDGCIHRMLDEQIGKPYIHGTGGKFYAIAERTGDKHLTAATHLPWSARDFLFYVKKLAKVKEVNRKLDVIKAAQAFVDKHKRVAEKMLELRGLIKVVTREQRAADKQDKKAEERKKLFTDNSTLVKVLKEHMQAFIDSAGEAGKQRFKYWMSVMKKGGWDIDKVAPKPSKDDNAMVAMLKDMTRSHYLSITDPVPGKEPSYTFRVYSKKARDAYIKDCRRNAEYEYMEWIAKMIRKIGAPVRSAKMVVNQRVRPDVEGNPWYDSTLTVKTTKGERQVWNTKLKINFSKYHKQFYQFPSLRNS